MRRRNDVIVMRKVDAEPLLWATAAHSVTGWLGGPRRMWTLTEALAVLERAHTAERILLDGQDALRLTSRNGSSDIYLNLVPPNLKEDGPWT